MASLQYLKKKGDKHREKRHIHLRQQDMAG